MKMFCHNMAIFFIFFTHFKSSLSTTSRDIATAIRSLYWMKMTMVKACMKGLNMF